MAASKKEQKATKKTAKAKPKTKGNKSTKTSSAKKGHGWLRRHLAGLLLASSLLFLLGISLVSVGYVVFLYR